jgi:hypothetical protein
VQEPTAAVYADLVKRCSEQSMKIRYAPIRFDGRPDLYAEWQDRQLGRA